MAEDEAKPPTSAPEGGAEGGGEGGNGGENNGEDGENGETKKKTIIVRGRNGYLNLRSFIRKL